MRPSDSARWWACLTTTLVLASPATGQRFEAWTLGPEWRLDGERADLSAVTFLAVSRTGRLAVAERQDHRVSVFAPDGSPAGTFGRRGEGPREFQGIFSGGWLADSLWVFDLDQLRVTLVDGRLGLLRTLPVRRGAVLPPFVYGVASGNLMTLLTSPPNGHPNDRAYVAYQAAEAALPLPNQERVLGRLPARGCAVTTADGRAGIQVPFCAQVASAAATDGRAVAVIAVEDGPAGNTFRATLIGARGDTIYSRRHAVERIAMPPKHFLDVRDRILAKTSYSAALVDQLKTLMPPPKFFPSAAFAFLGNDGRLWVGQYAATGKRYHVLSARGEPEGRIDVPESVRLLAADGERVWGVEADEDGLESVMRYRIQRPGGR